MPESGSDSNAPDEYGDGHDSDDRIELYVLDLLDDTERHEVEQLLAADPAARARARELRGVTGMLAFDLEPAQPSSNLRDRILTAARADLADGAGPLPTADSRPAVQPATTAQPSQPIDLAAERDRRRITTLLPWAVAAVLAIALSGSMIWNTQLRDELDERPDPSIFAVAPSDGGGDARGEIVILNQEGTAILTLSGLPELEEGTVYQVWLIESDAPAPEPNVTFSAGTGGLASIGVPGDVERYDVLAITIEPQGGSLAPTTDPILVSNLSEADDES